MWFLIFIFSLNPIYGQQRACNEQVVIDACNSMKSQSHEEYLSLSDGTRWKNPFYNPSRNITEAQISQQARILEQLEIVSRTIPLSDRFKNAFSSTGIRALLSSENNSSEPQYRLPMPPEDENGSLQLVSAQTIRRIFNSFPEAQKRSIQSLSESLRIPSEENIRNLNSEAVNLSPSQIVNPRRASVDAHFLRVKQTLIRSILKGRPRESLSDEEKSILARIESVQIAHGDHPEVAGHDRCADNAVDGFYSRRTHILAICPGSYLEPTPDLIQMLGHEIAHSFDPCSSQNAIEQLRNPKVSKDVTTIATSIPREQYPLSGVQTCLIQNIGVRHPTEVQIREIARDLARERQIGSSNPETLRTAENSIYLDLLENSSCRGAGHINTEINEAMSDVFGTIALNDYIAENPPQSNNDRLASLSHFLIEACHEIDEKRENPNHESSSKHAHPDSLKRVERFLLQSPAVSRSFNCRRNSSYSCYEDYLNAATTLSSDRILETPRRSTPRERGTR